MKHSMEHMRMHAIGDDELDIVSGGAGGAYDYTVICQGCSKELKPGRLVRTTLASVIPVFAR